MLVWIDQPRQQPAWVEKHRVISNQRRQHMALNVSDVATAPPTSEPTASISNKVFWIICGTVVCVLVGASFGIPFGVSVARNAHLTRSTETTTTTTLAPPTAVSSSSAYCSCGNIGLSLMNILFSTTNVTYQWQSSLMGQNIWSTISPVMTNSPFSISGLISSTDFRCEIVIQGSTPTIFTSTILTVTVGTSYCAPEVVQCSGGYTINTFVLIGESDTQINDLDTNCSANSYNNGSSQSVSLFDSMTYTAIVSCQHIPNAQLEIWIDFNDNFVFESFETVAYAPLNTIDNTQISLSIPPIGSGATVGVHRMRAVMAYGATPDPCAPSYTYGETHDYTVNITSYTPTSITYSQSFTTVVIPTTQCTAWINFVARLWIRPYTSLTLSGSADLGGVTVTNQNAINSIATALRTSTSYGPVTSNGHSWAVGLCGNGYELSANGAVCCCVTGYDVRPCHGTANYGGINGANCFGASQTITVTFTY